MILHENACKKHNFAQKCMQKSTFHIKTHAKTVAGQQKRVMKRIYIARTDTSLAPIESYERQLSIGAKLVSVRAI